MLAAALGLALAGCGGGEKPPPAPVAQRIAGAGFTFEAPGGWRVQKARGRATAAPRSGGVALLSVQTYRLLKPYRPALYAAASRELDVRTAELARTLRGRVAASRTVRVVGVPARQYDVVVRRIVQRLTYVLRGRNEYLLTCRFGLDERNPLDGACARLLRSFRLTPPPA